GAERGDGEAEHAGLPESWTSFWPWRSREAGMNEADEGSVSRREWLTVAGTTAAAAAAVHGGLGSAEAQSRPTADDLVRMVKGARAFDLSFTWNEQSPVLNLNPPYSFALNRTHRITHEIFGHVPA